MIQVENLAKEYTIGSRKKYQTFREMLTDKITLPFRRKNVHKNPPEKIWALNDVSFEVKEGEILGIIGRNGAGKSTLLKILSRITEPTSGRVVMHGRVSSLLEVGTGFHPELSGRENIYLNGTILGMKRSEIDRKFDEIVAFAEVEKFIDTPVKHYSSGMYVRLAFAVAASLEPEILLVDEVLAVGDVEFQRKCIGKMRDISGSGRTILFVSHNVSAIENLCNRAVLMRSGKIDKEGTAVDVISRYLSEVSVSCNFRSTGNEMHEGTGAVKIESFRILDNKKQVFMNIPMGSEVIFEIALSSREELRQADFQIIFHTHLLQPVTLLSSRTSGFVHNGIKNKQIVYCRVPALTFTAGRYFLTLAVYDPSTWVCYDQLKFVMAFDVSEHDVFKSGSFPEPADGPCYLSSDWSFLNQ